MTTQKRLTNLKFVFVILFAVFAIVGGFSIGTRNVSAASTNGVITVTYSLSEVISTTNSDGSITTKIMVGCAPGSGDVYDINTGKPCTYYTPKSALVGCAPQSGDKYDINTGKLCTNYKPTTLTGCAPQSGDIYDINTGKLCTNDTSIQSLALTPTSNTPTLTTSTPRDTTLPNDLSKQIVANELALVTTEPVETISKQEVTSNDDGISGRQILANSLSASIVKMGSVFSGPMSFWIIILLIAILLGGGYGIYSFRKKDGQKFENIKPVASQEVPVVKSEVKQQQIPLEKVSAIPPTTPEISSNNTNNKVL